MGQREHLLLAVPIFCGVAFAPPALAQSTCDAGKLKCMRSKGACLMKVHEKAIKTGLAPDGAKLGACQVKFDDPVKGCIAKLEAKQNATKPASLCSSTDHTALLESMVDACVAAALAGVGSAGGPGTCDSGKLKCMRTKSACILKVHEKAIKTGTTPDADKIASCRLKFDDPVKGCIAKLEAKQNVSKPATLCTVTGNAAALEASVDACVADAVNEVATCVASGDPEGLTATGAQFLHQDTPGVEGATETNDRFGSSLATGDFDADGFSDLVVGIPGENGVGAIAVLYGAQTGLFGTSRDQIFIGASLGISPTCDRVLTNSLTVGDFNGDGRDDLHVPVIRCLANCPGGTPCAAQSNMIYGSPTGLATLDTILNISVQHATAGNFNGDAYDDLIAVVSHEGPPSPDIDWRRILIPGSPSGLTMTGATRVFESRYQDVAVLASGDFDANPLDDLVEGSPTLAGGSVRLVLNPFSPAEAVEDWDQNSPGMVGGVEAGDDFGASLAIGDFDGDGNNDLAVGVPGESAAATGQGAFHRIFGDGSGLTATGNQLFGAITIQANAAYGGALAAGRFDNADAGHELAIGAASFDVPTFSDTGYVDVRFGSATRAQWWQGSAADTNVPGTLESGDRFGGALAVGDFNGDGADDLAIGVPGEDIVSDTDAGAVNVLYGTPSQCIP